ncbi:hypothetical protein D3C78_1611380 [compost metagenome]
METVHVFIRCDAFQHFHIVDACRERQLHQNAVDNLIGVQRINQLKQFCLGGRFGQIIRARDKTDLFTCFAFAADINL